MVSRSPNTPRTADAENTPPTASKAKVRGGIQGASRRRRARSAGGPHHPRHAVENARQKNATRNQPSQINIQLPRSSPEVQANSTAPLSMIPVSLPRHLCRPPFQPISREKIAAVAPELEDTEVAYIRQALRFLGPRMLHVLAGVKAEPASNVLPAELPVVVNDLSSDMPTHMLGVYGRDVPAASKRRVTLFPIHSIILSSHCSNLPILPPSNVTFPEVAGSTVTVPVVPLCIPAPEVFPQLSTFLYTKRVDHLLATLLPCPVPHALYHFNRHNERVKKQLLQFADSLATSHGAETLLTHVMAVNGMWRNACALGIDDARLWCALDVGWEILINALAISTGKVL